MNCPLIDGCHAEPRLSDGTNATEGDRVVQTTRHGDTRTGEVVRSSHTTCGACGRLALVLAPDLCPTDHYFLSAADARAQETPHA